MEKIALKALELAGYKNANQIAAILHYVPNPTVGLEMLLGVFEPRVVTEENRYFKDGDNTLKRITSFDELGNKVFFTNYNRKTKTAYYLTKSDFESSVFTYQRPSDGSYYTTREMKTNGYTSSVIGAGEDIDTFYSRNYYKPITADEFKDTLTEWDKVVEKA